MRHCGHLLNHIKPCSFLIAARGYIVLLVLNLSLLINSAVAVIVLTSDDVACAIAPTRIQPFQPCKFANAVFLMISYHFDFNP